MQKEQRSCSWNRTAIERIQNISREMRYLYIILTKYSYKWTPQKPTYAAIKLIPILHGVVIIFQ